MNDEKITKLKYLILRPKEVSLKDKLKAKPKETGDNNTILRIKLVLFSKLL